jgi:hypothetical protein
MSFTIQFTQRDLLTQAPAPVAQLDIERLEWRAVGGPWQARIRASGASLEKLWQLADLLRYEVKITDALGPAWWGYVFGVEVHAGSQVARVDLANVWNTIRVRYQDDSPSQAGGAVHYTGWSSDAASIRTWGTKEITLDLGPATAADAAAYAAACLAKWKEPAVVVEMDVRRAEHEDPFAILECRGWWETLDWMYYSQARGQASNLHGGSIWNFGNSVMQRLYQTFVSQGGAWDASEVWLKIKRVGVPTDGVTVEIATQDTGGTLASATVTASALEDDFTWVRFVLDTPASIPTSPARALRMLRTGAQDGVNFYATSADQGLAYSDGYAAYFNGAAWISTPVDLAFFVVGVEDTGVQLKAMVESGQFLTGCRCASSAIAGRLYREGTERTREEVERILQINGSQLARVSPSRRVEITARPTAEGALFRIGAGGVLERADGRPASCSDQPAGQWAQLGGMGDAGQMAGYKSAVFLERVIWDGEGLKAKRA